MPQNKPRGFTVIELMVVLVIIGILAAVAVPNFMAAKDRERIGTTKANMHTLQLVAEDYWVHHDGVYPTTIEELVPGLPDKNRLVNAFTNVRTEPSNNATPGSVIYQSDGHSYRILGIGPMSDTLSMKLTEVN